MRKAVGNRHNAAGTGQKAELVYRRAILAFCTGGDQNSRRVAAGWLGCKIGRGFYKYPMKKAVGGITLQICHPMACLQGSSRLDDGDQ